MSFKPNFAIVGILILLHAPRARAATLIYVDDDATPGGDGTSWVTAFNDLRDALVAADVINEIEFVEIRAGQGTYRPDRSTGDREASFRMLTNVSVLGGYAGVGAADPDDRDVDLYETILSGDLSNDDGPDFANYGDNSCHVVTSNGADDSTVIDGVIVTGGSATDSCAHPNGGGMLNDGGTITIRAATFIRNRAIRTSSPSVSDSGGGAIWSAGDLTLGDCLFVDNYRTIQNASSINRSGGAAIWNSGALSMSHCEFTDNTIDGQSAHGGGLFSIDGTTVIADSAFISNTAEDNGGGVLQGPGSTATLTNCEFLGNLANDAGGMQASGNTTLTNCSFVRNAAIALAGGFSSSGGKSVATLVGCTFLENKARFRGAMSNSGTCYMQSCRFVRNVAVTSAGGMANYGDGTLIDCAFIENRAGTRDGGGLWNTWELNLVNCLFIGNFAFEEGGAVYNAYRPVFTNCVFYANQAATTGGIFNIVNASPTLRNCILWGNRDDAGSVESSQFDALATIHPIEIVYSCLQGLTGKFGGEGNIAGDPLFVDSRGADDVIGTEDDDVRVLAGSPCIDAGGNPFVPSGITDDFGGLLRFVDDPTADDTGIGAAPVVDIGAHEYQDDCNGNGTIDTVDVDQGVSLDCDENLMPDECEPDCNGNSVADACDIADGASEDCTGDGVPDECDPDCNGNGAADSCDIAAGMSHDCNGNRIPDECDITGGTSADGDGDGAPDECYRRIYVDARATGLGTGSRWADAFNDLQAGLDEAADSGHLLAEVWVATGRYTPAERDGSRYATFSLHNRVAVYGGFAGDELHLEQRDPTINVTLLSGDLNDDDALDVSTTNGENSYHVVTGSSTDDTAILDGFTITGGNADGEDVDRAGGALYVTGAPRISRCVFANNSGHNGGAMFNARLSSPTVSECTFRWNESFVGGAILNEYSTATFVDCVFEENVSLNRGGAIVNDSCAPIIRDSLFLRNEGVNGGAVYNHFGTAHPKIIDCAFVGNRGVDGGAILNQGGEPTVRSCVFIGNVATNKGGAIYNRHEYTPTPALVNCTIVSNSAAVGGGFLEEIGGTSLTNCILWGNSDDGGSGGDAQIQAITGTSIVNYTCIQDLPHGLGGAGNTDVDPLFADFDGVDNIPGNADDDLRLAATSPVVNAGNPDFIAQSGELDLDGHARILCGHVDMGAFEFGVGDYDCDREANLFDFASWSNCFTGPNGGLLDAGCEAFDFDGDLDVDWPDFGGMQVVLGGSMLP